jgi:hypothetical protein
MNDTLPTELYEQVAEGKSGVSLQLARQTIEVRVSRISRVARLIRLLHLTIYHLP